MKRIGDLVARLPKFESCGTCSADGWVIRYRRYGTGDARLVRCSCWKAWQEKLAREVSAVSDTEKKRKS
jgi:hypothetical protein